MGKKSRDKGGRVERKLVKLLNEIVGVVAQRVPLSGAAGGDFGGDLAIMIKEVLTLTGEAKARAKAEGWKTLKKWKQDNELLFLVEDYQEPLVVMDFSMLKTLIEME